MYSQLKTALPRYEGLECVALAVLVALLVEQYVIGQRGRRQ